MSFHKLLSHLYILPSEMSVSFAYFVIGFFLFVLLLNILEINSWAPWRLGKWLWYIQDPHGRHGGQTGQTPSEGLSSWPQPPTLQHEWLPPGSQWLSSNFLSPCPWCGTWSHWSHQVPSRVSISPLYNICTILEEKQMWGFTAWNQNNPVVYLCEPNFK